MRNAEICNRDEDLGLVTGFEQLFLPAKVRNFLLALKGHPPNHVSES